MNKSTRDRLVVRVGQLGAIAEGRIAIFAVRRCPPRAQLSAGAVALRPRVNTVLMVPGKLRVFNGIGSARRPQLSIVITAPQFCTI